MAPPDDYKAYQLPTPETARGATLTQVLAILESRNLLNRVTKIETSDGVRLELAAAPAPISPVEAARQEANRGRTQAEFERRMRTGAVGAFIRKDIPE